MANMNSNSLGNLTEQVIASDMLLAAKSGIKSYAAALSETATPHVRNVLKTQLDDAIRMHEKLTNFAMEKGWYDAYNPSEQIRADLAQADTVLNAQ